MCKPKVDNTLVEQQKKEAEEARRREEERQGRIKEGMGVLDKEFGKFDDKFYGEREQAYLDFYEPQLTDQFKSAREQLAFALARAGLTNSTAAADKTAELDKQLATNRALIVSRAKDDVTGFKNRVNQEKSSLVSQLNATADATRISNDALGRTAQMFKEVPRYDPLGDIFLGVAQGIGGYYQAQQNQAYMDAAGLNPRRKSGTTVG